MTKSPLKPDIFENNIRKPLFINGKTLEYLCYRRPALEIKIEGKSWQNFPLRRISQICLIGSSKANISDLFELASKGIYVFSFTSKGKALTQLSSASLNNKVLEECFATNLLNEQFSYRNKQIINRYVGVSEALVPQDKYLNLVPRKRISYLNREITSIKAKNKGAVTRWFKSLLTTIWKKILLSAGITENSIMAMQLTISIEKISRPWMIFMCYQVLTLNSDEDLNDSVIFVFKQHSQTIEQVFSSFLQNVIDITNEPWSHS